MPSVTSRYLIICIGAVLMGSTALTSLSWSQQVGSDRALSEGDDAIFSDGNFDPFGDGQEQDGDPNSTDFDDEESLERDEEPRRSDFEQNAIDQLNNRQQRADGNQSARPAQQVGLIQPDGSVRTLANSRVRPVQGRAVPNDDDPYAALGIRGGKFLLFPTITQSIGITDNAESASDGSPSAFSRTDARLTAISQWALHELRAEIGGSYQTYFSGDNENVPTLDANVQLRLDHSYDITTTFQLNYDLSTESASSDNLTVPPPLTITEDPNVHRFGGFAQIEKRIGHWNTNLRGTVTHSEYEDASLSDGSSLSQADRTSTLYELRGRVGYGASPIFQPFVEASAGQRVYVVEVDRNGNTRDSVIYGLRGGVAFDRGTKFNGEFSIGYSSEQFDDAALDDLNGLTFDASINWSPQRLTTLTATAETSFTGSTNAGESGSVTYATSLNAVHDLRPNLSLNAQILASLRDYDSSGREDRTLQGQVGSEIRINRTAALVGNIGYEVVESTDADSSYSAATARLGLRLQR